ncbi:hypothetical protein ABPG74_014841 [Tetrahymena malaccensis]
MIANNGQQHETQYKDRSLILKIILTYCLGQFFWGFQLGVYTSSQEPIHKTLEINEDFQAAFDGFITSLLPIGGLIGSLMSMYIFKYFSRRYSMIVIDLLGIVGCFFNIFIYSTTLFSIGRFLLGLNAGFNSSLVCTIVKEITPVEMLQQGGTLPIFINNMGVFIAYLLGIGFASSPNEPVAEQQQNSNFYLFFVYLFPVIFPVIRILLLKYKYTMETPFFYIENGMDDELQYVLEILYKEKYVHQVSQDYYGSYEEKQRNSNSSSDIFSTKNMKRLQIGITLMYFMQMSGTYAIIFFATKIFSQATNGNTNIALYLTVGIGLTPVICSYIAGQLSQKHGRKPLLKNGMAGLVCINFILSFFAYVQETRTESSSSLSICIIIFTFFSRSYTASAYGPNSFAYSADILCPKSLSLIYLFYWGFEAIVGFIFPILIDSLGLSFAFFFFAMNCAAGFYFVHHYIKETKGLTRKQVECLFDEQQSLIDDSLHTKLFEMV